MIISKKRFDQEVKRRANAICRAELNDALLEKYGKEINKLNREIRKLKKELAKPKEGSINGFYAKPNEVTIIKEA